jgi:CBS-domain-containing membrane protein
MKSPVRDAATIQPWTPFREIVTRLAEHRISAAPVPDAEGNVLGIVTSS